MKRLLVSLPLLLTIIAGSSAWGIELRQIQPVTQLPPVSKTVVAPVLSPDILKVAIPPAAPALFVTLTQGKSYTLKLSTKNFDLNKQLSFGEGIVAADKPVMSGTEVTLNIRVNSNAPVGKHAITITSGTQPRTAAAYLNVAAAPIQPVTIQPAIKPVAELPAKEIPTQPVSGAPKAVIIPPPVKEPIKEIANLPLPPKPPVPVEGKPVAPVAGAIKKDVPAKIGSGLIKVEPRELPVKEPVKEIVKLAPQSRPPVPIGGKRPLDTVNKSGAAPAAKLETKETTTKKPAPRPVNVVKPPVMPPAPLVPRPLYSAPAAPGQTVVQQARAGVPPGPADRVPAPGSSLRRMREISGFNFTGNTVNRSREIQSFDFAGSAVNYSREIQKFDFVGSP